MTRGDLIVERTAGRLDALARRAAAGGGLAAKLAEPLAADAALLRVMRPSLVAARLRGGTPDGTPAPTAAIPPAEPNHEEAGGRSEGPSPILLAAAGFALGLLLAKLVDWRGHAHPRF